MNTSNSVLFTVVMLTYNHGDFIEDAVRAILRQDYVNPFEFLIFDDASLDNTQEIIENITDIPNHIIFRYVRHDTNIGSVKNFNFAMKCAKGDIIVIADGDDVSLPCRLSALANAHQRYKKSLYVSNAWLLRETSSKQTLDESKYYSNFNLNNISIDEISANKVPVFGASYAFHRDLFDKYKDVDVVWVTYNNVDYQIFWRAFLERGVCYLNEKLLIYRIHKKGLSLNKMNDFDLMQKIKYTLNKIGNMIHLLRYKPFELNELLFECIKVDFDNLISLLAYMEDLQNKDKEVEIQLGYRDKIIFNGVYFDKNIDGLMKLRLDEYIFVLNKLFLDKKLSERNVFLIYNACKRKEISKREIVILFYLLSNKYTMPLNLTFYNYFSLIFLIFKNKMRVIKLRKRIVL